MHRAKLFCRAFGCALLAIAFAATAHGQCQLNSPSGDIKHVVYVEFDNVHFTRDNPERSVGFGTDAEPAEFHRAEWHARRGRPHGTYLAYGERHPHDADRALFGRHRNLHRATASVCSRRPRRVKSGLFPSSFFYWTDMVSDITPATGDSTFALTTPSGTECAGAVGAFHASGMHGRRLLDGQHCAGARAIRRSTRFSAQTSPQAAETAVTSDQSDQ